MTTGGPMVTDLYADLDGSRTETDADDQDRPLWETAPGGEVTKDLLQRGDALAASARAIEAARESERALLEEEEARTLPARSFQLSGLAWWTTTDQLLDLLRPYGAVVQQHMYLTPQTGQFSGTVDVTMDTVAAAVRARTAMQRQGLQGRTIVIRAFRTPPTIAPPAPTAYMPAFVLQSNFAAYHQPPVPRPGWAPHAPTLYAPLAPPLPLQHRSPGPYWQDPGNRFFGSNRTHPQ